jgi:PqqD family protein of HPr-rel-A system
MAEQLQSRRPLRRGDVSSFPLDQELVVFDSVSGEAFLLNPTAAAVWALCDGEHTLAEIASELASAYGLGYQDTLSDVHELLRRLYDQPLLTV